MNISSRCEYACRAVIELARYENESTPVTAVQIAKNRGIPEKFLVHILLQLKRSGLVRSMRGAQGGYMLARDAEEITLLDIVRAIDGPILDPLPGEHEDHMEMTTAWREIAFRINEAMDSLTIREIITRSQAANMYHI